MSNLVLYRKYRPKTFAEVIGQEHIVQTLTNAVSQNMISHGYLFCGPHGTGKTTIARLVAKSLNCQSRGEGKFEPCNECSSCLEINQGNAMDLIEIDAASNRGIDEIRDLKDGIRFRPAKSKYKVFVVDECLTGDHLIILANGTVKKISDIKNREKVASVDLKNGKVVSGEVQNWFKRETDKIIKIRTPQTTLKCTPAHRMWIFRDTQFLLTEAKNIKMGDFLLSPVYLPHTKNNNLTPAQLSLLALIQCDGHVSKDSITTQIEIQKDRDYFTKVSTQGFKAWKLKEKSIIKTTSRGTRLIRIYSKELKETLIKLGCPQGKKTDKIDIPDEVFQAPLKSIKAYIDTCFCCEGDISVFGVLGNINYKLNFNSGSEIFTKKLQILLKKFGIASNIIEIQKKNIKHSTMFRLSLSGYNLRLFHEEIGLSMARKNKLINIHFNKNGKQDCMPIEKIVIKKQKEVKLPCLLRASLGIYPDLRQHLSRKAVVEFIRAADAPELNKYLQFRYEKVKRIETLEKKEEVYDFTVEGTHTFIVDGICSSNCHQLTKEASNALLKTLEEPPSHAIFILATTEGHKMIATIQSRCQRFDFRKLTMQEIVKRMERILTQENIVSDKDALNLIAQQASGSVRDAETLLDEVVSFSGKSRKIELETIQALLGTADKTTIFQLLNFLTNKQTKEAIQFINELIFKGVDLKELVKSVIQYLREVLLLKINPESKSQLILTLTDEEKQKLQQIVQIMQEPELKKAIEYLMEAETKMKYATILQLPLELAIIDICQKIQ